MTETTTHKDLIIKIEDICESGLSGTRVLEPTWFSLPPSADDPIRPIRLLAPISAHFQLERVGTKIRLNLSLGTSASLTCARCLEPFPFPVCGQSLYMLSEAIHASTSAKEQELTPEHLESETYQGDEIDLSERIYEQIVLSFPIKPLCRQDCKGLCPHCGANRNMEKCQCIRESTDPRWEALRKLKQDDAPDPHGRRAV